MRKQIFTRRSSSPSRKRRDFEYFDFWCSFGLSTRAATAATAAGCRSLDELRDMGWHGMQFEQNCGLRTLEELSNLVGGWPDAPPQRGRQCRLPGKRRHEREKWWGVAGPSLVDVAYAARFESGLGPLLEQDRARPAARWIQRAF